MRKDDEPAPKQSQSKAPPMVVPAPMRPHQVQVQPPLLPPPSPPIELKTGYRQGLITSITVVLTASVLFFRFAVFEGQSGEWSTVGAVAAVLAAASIAIQLLTLWRALQPEDAEIAAYRTTLKCFVWAVGFLVASLLVQSAAYPICPNDWAQGFCFPWEGPVQPGPSMPV
jgi:hypothetical protein